MKETITAIAQQVNANELHLAKFRIVADEKNDTLIIVKGVKSLAIKYDYGSDTYILTEYRKSKQVGQTTNIYCDMLQSWIS